MTDMTESGPGRPTVSRTTESRRAAARNVLVLLIVGAVAIASAGSQPDDSQIPRPGGSLPPLPQPTQQPSPVFRSRVDLIQVDVTVLDERRMPVRGLQPSDFNLFEDGAPREIVAFTEMTASEPDAPPESWLRRTVPDVTVNNAEDGRLLLIIMDDARTPVFPAHVPGGPAIGPDPRTAVKQVARAIVERMGPSDLASIIFTVKNKGEQEFTSDRTRLFAAIEGFEQAGPGATTQCSRCRPSARPPESWGQFRIDERRPF